MIRNIQLYHAGKYICVVDTDVESLSAVAVLIVKGKKTRFAPQSLIKRGAHSRGCVLKILFSQLVNASPRVTLWWAIFFCSNAK